MFKIVEDHPEVMVALDGTVKYVETGNTITPQPDKDGYLRFGIWSPSKGRKINLSVHRCVAIAYIPNPENKPCVNHKDCDRVNNDISNLEWVTVAENNYHGMEYGSIVIGKLGEENTNNVHSEEIVHKICQMLQDGVRQVKISKVLEVPLSFVYDVRSATTWKEINSQYNIPPVKKNLQPDTVHLICKDLQSGLDYKSIEVKYSLGDGVLRFIKNRKTFKHISKDYNWD
ncbi:HNH homing endonuclease [Pseudoalteromonas phage H101]|uniref:HNH homing endonuclease n=1 Tax=Pseudoalteromonas phage H101 TaxID=1654919 RepID=A0A0H4J1Z4_9CAUD|nr:HNH homing endonuclease [Pseudoalteromonas phage H101]AKO60915.1 HNH homing endonuclease [Pseudoalteromonas phage H101]